MGHYENLKTQNLGMDSDLYLVLKAKLMHQKSIEEVTIIGIPPITIISNGNNATVGLKGNTETSGTPSPDNPVMPEGTGERTGNLLDESIIQNGYYGALGSYSVFTADNKYRCFKLDLPAGTYTVSITADEDMYLLRCSNSVEGAITVYSAPPYTFTLSADATIYVSWRNTDTTNSFTNMKVMLNLGSTTLPYEPYGIKIPISSAGQTTPVYLGEVQSTRNIKKLVLTGQESWQITSNNKWLYFELADVPTRRISPISSHYTGSSTVSYANLADNSVTVSIYDNNQYRLALYDSRFTTVADFKTYLQQQYTNETPVTVWYILATPTTGIVNEPLMRIGGYVDEVSNITVPTTKGINIVDVNTEVKPSEISITYTKGKGININNISDMEKLTIADLEKMTIAELEG